MSLVRARVPDWFAPTALFALALALRLLGLDRRSVWFDEAVTWVNGHMPLSQVWAAAGADVHPPLGYVLYALWPWLDSGDFLLRLPQAVLGAVAAPLAWAWARRVAGPGVGLVTGLFVAVSPFLVDLAQEARMYGLLLTLVAGSLLLLDRLVERPNRVRAIAYGLVAVGLLYTHYYGAMMLAAEGIGLLLAVRSQRRGALLGIGALVVAGVLFLPWVPSLLGQMGGVQGGYWIERPTLTTAWTTFRDLTAHTPADAQLRLPLRVAYVAIAGLVGLGAVLSVRDARRRVAVCLLVVAPLVAVALSLLVAPIYVARYLSPISLALAMLAGVGALWLPQWGRWVALAVLFFPAVTSLPSLYLDEGYSRTDLRGAAAYVKATRGADEVMVHLGAFSLRPFEYYGVGEPAAVMETETRAEVCDALRGHAGGWMVTVYPVADEQGRADAEAGILSPGYSGELVVGEPARFLGTTVVRLRTCEG